MGAHHEKPRWIIVHYTSPNLKEPSALNCPNGVWRCWCYSAQEAVDRFEQIKPKSFKLLYTEVDWKTPPPKCRTNEGDVNEK